ncbi:Peptidase S10, serine carboxypeptidase [Dillenia turbinata]|uniref:Peptidase S10, serine carboxypeptidase n=1 Tax=Dillenia turbinata TaxID=194707 RepID=A0AAN8ZH12_9MAGN
MEKFNVLRLHSILSLFILASAISDHPQLPEADPDVSVKDLGHHAGYYKIEHSQAARMFYLFFESRNSPKDPVVIWLTGGPGCSSELAVLYENVPFTISKNLSLVWNERDIRHNEVGVNNDLYDFLQAFFAEHPQFLKNDFYIIGESYEGHYIPAFASRVHQGNKAKEGVHINLKVFAIGNGLTDPKIQYKAYTDYALDMGIISKTDYDRINKVLPACELAIKLCDIDGTVSCMASYLVCNTILSRIREAFGVGELKFVSCNPTIYQDMLMDWMRNLVGIPALLEDGVKLLVYTGAYDLICNWLGNSRWVHTMDWSGKQSFVGSAEVPFLVDGAETGVLKTYGPLSFLGFMMLVTGSHGSTQGCVGDVAEVDNGETF